MTTPRRRFFLIVTVLLLTMIAFGCSDDETDSSEKDTAAAADTPSSGDMVTKDTSSVDTPEAPLDTVPEAAAPDTAPDTAPLPEPAPEVVEEVTVVTDTATDTATETIGETIQETAAPMDTIFPFDTEGIDPMVAACMSVLGNTCGMIAECKDLALVGNLINDSIISGCVDWLSGKQDYVEMACQGLLEPSDNPDILMIQAAGPTVLEACTDNFQCTLEQAIEIGAAVVPLFTNGGAQDLDVVAIVNIITTLCF